MTTTKIKRVMKSASILIVTGPTSIGVRAGTALLGAEGRVITIDTQTSVDVPELTPGHDYGVIIDDNGRPSIASAMDANPLQEGFIAGFHFAPGGNARDKSGGDTIPAINLYSLWDLDHRPSCPDPRGMALVTVPGGKVWVDIYLLGTSHMSQGTSRCGATIADGRDLPDSPDGKGATRKLDYATSAAIYAHHGKRLLGAEEFFAAAYGVQERCSRDSEPTVTGVMDDDAKRFISRHGLFDATGTMWIWGTDGHPDDPRPSVFGGSWLGGSSAGSRFALLDDWPDYSYGDLSARGACDHLTLV